MSGDVEARQEQSGHSGYGTQRNPAKAAVSALKHDTHAQDPAFTQARTAGAQQTEQSVPHQTNGIGSAPRGRAISEQLEVLSGPLLNYRRMSGEHTRNPIWHGSVLIVCSPGSVPEPLSVSCVGPAGSTGMTNGHSASLDRTAQGVRLYEDPTKSFWQFSLELPFQEQESAWEYTIPRMVSVSSNGSNLAKPKRFYICAKSESFRIMFHSCNGFSVGTDEDAWSGPALWNDVMRLHQEQPFHVMVGGGDQIYNDSVRVSGPLRPWTDIANPKKRRDYPFNEDMRAQCDKFYFDNYAKWYSTEPFASANGQIPQVNIWVR